MILTIPMVLLLATIVFFVMRVIPGDPVVTLMGARAGSEEQIEVIRHTLGLDRPLYVQYVSYISSLITGDFGYSLSRGASPVLSELLTYFPATLELALWSIALAIPLGIGLAIIAARRHGSRIDATIRFGALVRWCMPVFWLGTMLQILVVLYVPMLPLSGRLSPAMNLDRITGLYVLDSILTMNIDALVDSLKHLILPVLTLGTIMAASLTRFARANLLEELSEEYVTVARLKGCSEKQIFRKHVLPNALIPILTYGGLQTAAVIGGSVLTETVFSWPGLGRLMLFAVGYRDFNLIQGCIVFYALMTGAINLIVDVLYAVVDPRVRY
jgi:peptide/nickel transport system permease protein